MKIKQIPNLSLMHSFTVEPLYRKDIIDEIVKNLKVEDNQHAHITYLYGEGGIGKTYICRSLDKYITEYYKQENDSLKFYSIYYDVSMNSEYPVKLMELAMLLREVLKEPTLFEVFENAFTVYVKKYQEQWSTCSNTKDTLLNPLDTVLDVIACIPGFSSISDWFRASQSVANLITSEKKNKEFQDKYGKFESLPLDDLKLQLCYYFALDLNNYFKSYKNKNKRIVIIIDTFEALLFKDKLSQHYDSRLTDWLLGDNGIIRLLTNSFWVLAGREKINWSDYDPENSAESFKNIQINVPEELKVINFLEDTGMGYKYAVKIAKNTHCYPLHFGKYVNLYLRYLRNKQALNSEIPFNKNDFILDDEEFEKISNAVENSSIVSDRFLYYFNTQEKDVIYTLACLKYWNDEILSNVIWKENSNNFSFYESIKSFSFIKKERTIYEMQTTSLKDLIKDCPLILKEKLINCMKNAIEKSDDFVQNSQLLCSLLHISLYQQISIKSWQDLMLYLYKVMNSLFELYKFEQITRLYQDCMAILEESILDCVGYRLFKSSVLIYQYICNCIYSLRNKESLIVLEKEKLFATISTSLVSLTEEELEYGIHYSCKLAYELFNKFSLFGDANDLMKLILVNYYDSSEQLLDERIFKYITYRTVIVAEAYLYAQSWISFRKGKNKPHAIELSDEELAFGKLKNIIDLLSKNSEGQENLLSNLIFSYVQFLATRLGSKIVHIIEKEKENEHTEPTKDEVLKYEEDINKYLNIYKSIINEADVTEWVNSRYLECLISFKKMQCEKTLQLIFSFIEEYVTKYGIDLNYSDLFINLFSYAHYSIFCRTTDFTQDFLNSFSIKRSTYKKLFDTIVMDFYKTEKLDYLRTFDDFDYINRNLFHTTDLFWQKHILTLDKIPRKSLSKNFTLLSLYSYCLFIAPNTNFHAVVPIPEKMIQPLDRPVELLNPTQIRIILSYINVNKCICKEIIHNLSNRYRSTIGENKNSVALALLQFFKKVYDYKIPIAGDIVVWKNIFEQLPINDIDNLKILLEERSYGIYGRTCFDDFRGWIFHQNQEDDKKFLQESFEIMYEIMLNEDLKLGEDFYQIISFIFNKYTDMEEYVSFGYALLRYVKYATDYDGINHHVKNKFSEEQVMDKIKQVKMNYPASKFAKDSILVKELTDYGLLKAVDDVDIEQLLLNNKFEDAKAYWDICKNSNVTYIYQKFYNVIFYESKEKINQFLEETKTDLFLKIDLDSKEFRICLQGFILLKGYKLYKTKDEFLALSKKLLPYLIKDLCSNNDTSAFFSSSIIEMLKFLVSDGAYEQVKSFIASVFEKEKISNDIKKTKYEQSGATMEYQDVLHIHYAILTNFNIVSDLYKVSELFSDSLIKELIGSSSDRCIKVYNALHGYLPEEHLRQLIFETSAKILDSIFSIPFYFRFEGGLDGFHYHKLLEIFGEDLNEELDKYCPYFLEARRTYLKNYSILFDSI